MFQILCMKSQALFGATAPMGQKDQKGAPKAKMVYIPPFGAVRIMFI